MRKYAFVNNEIDVNIANGFIIKKVMLYETPKEGTYLFLYDTVKDSNCCADYYFETVIDAEEKCLEEYKVEDSDWIQIEDPLPDCQHDFIAPIRVKGRDNGQPQWDCLEIYINGIWEDFKPTK